MSLDHYKLSYLVAVTWNDEMAQRFPNADHHGCRQEMFHNGTHWESYSPARCRGYHCNRCGAATGSFGHTDCPDKPEPEWQ